MGHFWRAPKGQKRIVKLRFTDKSLGKYQEAGVIMRALMDVQPGTYLVRSVVRDSVGGLVLLR